jgi:hypothetical protein
MRERAFNLVAILVCAALPWGLGVLFATRT